MARQTSRFFRHSMVLTWSALVFLFFQDANAAAIQCQFFLQNLVVPKEQKVKGQETVAKPARKEVVARSEQERTTFSRESIPEIKIPIFTPKESTVPAPVPVTLEAKESKADTSKPGTSSLIGPVASFVKENLVSPASDFASTVAEKMSEFWNSPPTQEKTAAADRAPDAANRTELTPEFKKTVATAAVETCVNCKDEVVGLAEKIKTGFQNIWGNPEETKKSEPMMTDLLEKPNKAISALAEATRNREAELRAESPLVKKQVLTLDDLIPIAQMPAAENLAALIAQSRALEEPRPIRVAYEMAPLAMGDEKNEKTLSPQAIFEGVPKSPFATGPALGSRELSRPRRKESTSGSPFAFQSPVLAGTDASDFQTSSFLAPNSAELSDSLTQEREQQSLGTSTKGGDQAEVATLQERSPGGPMSAQAFATNGNRIATVAKDLVAQLTGLRANALAETTRTDSAQNLPHESLLQAGIRLTKDILSLMRIQSIARYVMNAATTMGIHPLAFKTDFVFELPFSVKVEKPRLALAPKIEKTSPTSTKKKTSGSTPIEENAAPYTFVYRRMSRREEDEALHIDWRIS